MSNAGLKANFVKQALSVEEQEKIKLAFAKKCAELCKQDLELDENKNFKYSYDNFIRLVVWKDFSDLRISQTSILIESHSWEEYYEMKWFDFPLLYEHLNAMVKELWVNNYIDGKYFSFHLPIISKTWELYLQGFRGLLKTSIDGNEMTIRKLTTPRNNLNEFIYDHVLIECVLKALLSRKGFAISGRTGSGKSTILISLLNFFNKTNYTDVLLDEIERVIFEMLGEEQAKDWKEGKVDGATMKFIKEAYNSIANIDIIKQDIKLCLNALRNFVFKKYSKKWEILSSITILKLIKLKFFIEQPKNERLRNGGKVLVYMFDEYAKEIQKRLLEAENKPINQAIKKFSQSRLRNITTLEEPIEFIYGKDGILRFYQHSISQHFNGNYFEFINQILRDNPHVCYIAEVRNQDEIDTFLTSMSLGITSMTTCHSYDSLEVLLKFIDLSSKGKGEVMNMITNSYHTGINIDSYFFVSLKSVLKHVSGFVQWYDFLDFSDNTITTAFKNYYEKNNFGTFVEMLNEGYIFHWDKLAYYPKKLTLNYRLMLLWEEVNKKMEILKTVPEFNYGVFVEEMIDLIYNTGSILKISDRQLLEKIYGVEDAQRVMTFVEQLSAQPQWQAKIDRIS